MWKISYSVYCKLLQWAVLHVCVPHISSWCMMFTVSMIFPYPSSITHGSALVITKENPYKNSQYDLRQTHVKPHADH